MNLIQGQEDFYCSRLHNGRAEGQYYKTFMLVNNEASPVIIILVSLHSKDADIHSYTCINTHTYTYTHIHTQTHKHTYTYT